MRARPGERPRRPSALRTRRKLLNAARRAFAAKGLGGASLREDVLARTGISTGSFYHQFADKQDLLLEVLRVDGTAVLELLEKWEASGDAGPTREIRLLHALFDLADRHPDFVKISQREYHSDSARVRRQIRRHRELVVAVVRRRCEALAEQTGLGLDADAIATLLSVQGAAILHHYLELPKRRRPGARERLIRSLLQLGGGGILAMRTGGSEPPSGA